MKLEKKKNIILFISLINTVLNCLYLGTSIAYQFDLNVILYELFFVIVAAIPFLLVRLREDKHTYFSLLPFAINSFMPLSVGNFTLSVIGMIITLIPSDKEKNMVKKLVKKYPMYFAITVIIAGMACLNFPSFLEKFASLVYGFNMLGEFLAALFVFFMIIVLGKKDLIFKNRGSVKESILVSLPFIIFILYEAFGLFAMNIAEGYSLNSLDEVITIVLLYLFVGIFEDFLLRGLSLNILLDKFGNTKKGKWLSILLSSIFFGLVHFINLTTGASLSGVIIQAISATFIGFYFSAIYLRSGSVWAPALLHGFYDLAVSVTSLFNVTEITDTSEAFADTISNYSWAGLIFPFILFVVSFFLLRKSKMEEVIARDNGEEIKKKNDKALKYLLVGFSTGFTVFICYLVVANMMAMGLLTKTLYKALPTSTDYQKEYGLTYINGTTTFDTLSDEVKILTAINNLESDDYTDGYSISDAESDVVDKEIITTIPKEKIDTSLSDIFGDIDTDLLNYVDVDVSFKTNCSYDNDSLSYICKTTNTEEDNNLKVYSNIASIDFSDTTNIVVYVYYLVYDAETNIIYADSNLKTVYMYDTDIASISGSVSYDEDDLYNKKFWNNILENTDGVPTYKLTFSYGVDGMYFTSSEFLENSIESVVSEENIEDETYRYTSSKYSFTYDRTYFTLEENGNSLSILYNDSIVIKIEEIDSSTWLSKYDKKTSIEYFGNNKYYCYSDECLIYSNDFYLVKINYTGNSNINKLIKELLNTLEYEEE